MRKTGQMTKLKIAAYILLAIGITGFILSLPAFLRLVEILGSRIPQKDIRIDYIRGFAWAFFLGMMIFIWPVRADNKKALLLIWLVKSFVMLGPMLLYEYYYSIDSFTVFSNRCTFSWELMTSEKWPNLPACYITWLHDLIHLESFHAAKVTFGMIGLIAVYIFYRAAVIFLRQEKIKVLYIIAFFPSILFWSSTLGKEPLVFFGIAVYCYGVIKWIRTGLFRDAVIAISGVIIAANIRTWLGTILIPPFFIIVLTKSAGNLRSKIPVLTMLILTFVFFNNSCTTSWGVRRIDDLPQLANRQFNNFAKGSSVAEKQAAPAAHKEADISPKEGSAICRPPSPIPNNANAAGRGKSKFNNLKDMLLSVPRGMFTVLFRPLPGDVNNVFGLLAGLEDSLLLILFSLALKRIQWRKVKDQVCIWAILLILVWAVAYSFVGYNLGTICRYKIQILPIFLGLLLYQIYDTGKTNTKEIYTSGSDANKRSSDHG